MIIISGHKLKRGLQGFRSLLGGYPFRFDMGKKQLIDFAFKNVIPTARSFADLGGVWKIHGAYTFYILDRYTIESAFLVDTDFTSKVQQKSQSFKNLAMVQGNFGSDSVSRRLGHVDVILLLDVLLHQVNPDWNEILEMYSAVTNCFVIFNQQFIASEATVRLPDLGVEEYFKHVPLDRSSLAYKNLFEKPEEIHPHHHKPWRDVHNVWQWGITDKDLLKTMNRLGFSLQYQKNNGRFSNFSSFENHAFVFLKADK